jgi:hypothetical protein
MKTLRIWMASACVLGIGATLIITALSVLADDPPEPALTIAPLGGNQFSITITNAAGGTNYTLFWTPALADEENYPWQVLATNAPGETNFMIDAGVWPIGWFRVLVGFDQDGDGIPEWQDAQPLDPNVGLLDVTIDFPVNGTTID